ncbi:MAG: ATP-binding protein [Lachnospiraceae bacterium]|nr:ATP-binding protein [Sarcina sp.]MBQ6590215.1 ATP-binding protein [Lachnospiraceae bacterium]
MYRLTSKLIVYREIGEDSILMRLADVCRQFDKGDYDREALTAQVLDQIHRLLDLATRYGFDKNLWHNYLAFLLAMTETPFTLVSEKVGANDGSVNHFVKSDLRIFRRLFDYDFSRLEKALETDVFSIIENYHSVGKKERVYNRSVSEKVQALSLKLEESADEDDMYRIVTDFYRDYGVGMFGLNKAFRINERWSNSSEGAVPEAGAAASVDYAAAGEDDFLIPITATSDVVLDDLIGYELQKERLIANTEAFVSGRTANNVLLYGDAGTGKSTSIKAILNQYYDRGLRMIEVYKHEFRYLQRILAEVKNRNYRFIIYMDDLSFEEFEIEYKYLKAVIEGGLETKPENVLIYATSNRRHLIRETWSDRSDRSDDELHRSDTMQEKLSLVARFGISIGYMKPSHKEYLHIVKELAAKYPQITLTEEELLQKANQWELRSGGASGRTAQQFINYLAGASD